QHARQRPRRRARLVPAVRLDSNDQQEEATMSAKNTTLREPLSRREVLKGAAATAGMIAGSGAIGGFPTIWAQNLKDIKLVQVGGSYSAIIDIAKQATKDLGFQVEMQTGAHDALLNRFVTQPNSVDIADTLGTRPDIVKRPIEHWHELLNPEFKGRAAILDVPSIGIMDAAMAIESRGDIKYGDKGNMTKEEIDKTIKILIDAKKSG